MQIAYHSMCKPFEKTVYDDGVGDKKYTNLLTINYYKQIREI